MLIFRSIFFLSLLSFFGSSFCVPYAPVYTRIRLAKYVKSCTRYVCLYACSRLLFDSYASHTLNNLQPKLRKQTSFILIKFHCHCTEQRTGRFNFQLNWLWTFFSRPLKQLISSFYEHSNSKCVRAHFFRSLFSSSNATRPHCIDVSKWHLTFT